MKKIISSIVAIAMTMAVAIPVFAATTVQNSDGTWTTSGADAGYANKMITVIAYTPSEEGITVDGIQYIDQTIADANGAFAFEDYLPKDDPEVDYPVKLGIEKSSVVIDAGSIKAPSATTVDNNNGTWTTSGSYVNFANKMMTVIAYEVIEGNITVDSVQYVDQTVADENGAFAFEYTPKEVPTTSAYVVKVGSEVLTKAIDAGSIRAPGLPPVAVTGNVSAIGNATVTVTFKQNGETITSANMVDGAFTADVVPGIYDVEYTAPGYLKHTVTGVPVETAPALKNVKLKAGDVDGINGVTVEDIGFVVGAYSDDAMYHITKDFDANNDVTIEDIGFAVGNYKEVETVEAYSAN